MGIPIVSDQPTRLFNRNYVLLWQGKFLSRIGINAMSMVILLWIKETTGSATLMGLVAMMSGIPAIVFGVMGGIFADSYSRRGIILWADAIKGGATMLLGSLFLFSPENVGLLTVTICVLMGAGSVLDSFATPALAAAIPDLVPRKHLTQANTLGQLSIQLSVFLGQGFGGVLFRLAGPFFVSLGTAVAQFWSAVSVLMIRIPQPHRATSAPKKQWRAQVEHFRGEVRAGFTYVMAESGLKRLVIASTLLSFFGGLVMILLPYLAIDHLKQPADWVGFLSAGFGVGSLFGFIAAGVLRLGGKARSTWLIVLMVANAAAIGLLGFVQVPVVTLMVIIASGMMGGFIAVNLTTIVQMNTPSEIRGRVFGVLSTLSGGLAPLGMGLGGAVFDLTGQNITLTYLMCGVIMAAVILQLTSSERLRLYLSQELTPQPEPVTDPLP